MLAHPADPGPSTAGWTPIGAGRRKRRDVPYTARVTALLFVSVGVLAGVLLLILGKRWMSAPVQGPRKDTPPPEWPERSLREALDNGQLAAMFLDARGAGACCSRF